MEGIAYSNADLLGLLPSETSTFDEHVWLISTQGGWWPNSESLTVEEMDKTLDESRLGSISGVDSECELFDQGSFSWVAHHIGLDEWTYLIALPADRARLPHSLADLSLTSYLSERFFRSLAAHDATLICYIDEWWEAFPSSSPLLEGVGIGLHTAATNSAKWISYQADPQSTPIRPNFEGQQGEAPNHGSLP